MEDHNKKSFFDDIAEDGFQKSPTSENSSYADEIATKAADNLSILIEEGSKCIAFREMTSVESYRMRGFIKEGDLTDSPRELLLDKYGCTGERIKTEYGDLIIFGEERKYALCRINDTNTGVKEIEQLIIKTLTEKSDIFNPDGMNIFVVGKFYDSLLNSIVPTTYLEFKGHFVFIKADNLGWMLFRHYVSALLSEGSE